MKNLITKIMLASIVPCALALGNNAEAQARVIDCITNQPISCWSTWRDDVFGGRPRHLTPEQKFGYSFKDTNRQFRLHRYFGEPGPVKSTETIVDSSDNETSNRKIVSLSFNPTNREALVELHHGLFDDHGGRDAEFEGAKAATILAIHSYSGLSAVGSRNRFKGAAFEKACEEMVKCLMDRKSTACDTEVDNPFAYQKSTPELPKTMTAGKLLNSLLGSNI
jgi:hypothetical protein